MADTVDDEGVSGWQAIEAACERAHPGIEPAHWGTIVRWHLGGNDPLDGVSAYPVDGPEPHWHYVSYGLTELYDKTSPNPDESGWGFELTFRLRRQPGETAPLWPMGLLQNLARYVFNSGNWFEAGHHIDVNGPIATDEDTHLTALVMVADPELGTIDSPNGAVAFVQLVGIDADELEVVREWDAAKFAAAVARRSPLLVTDLGRESYLADPAFEREVRAGMADDGSSLVSLVVPRLGVERDPAGVVVRIDANVVEPLRTALPARLPHGRPFALEGDEGRIVRFEPGAAIGVRDEEGTTVITLTPDALAELLDRVRPASGRYALTSAPGVVIDVIDATDVTDVTDDAR